MLIVQSKDLFFFFICMEMVALLWLQGSCKMERRNVGMMLQHKERKAINKKPQQNDDAKIESP